jgi:hypothetical protein
VEVALAVLPIAQLAWVILRLEQLSRRVRDVEARVEALEVAVHGR